MLAFTVPTLGDKPWVDEIVMSENSPSADFNFGNIYIWDARYRPLIARFGGRLLTRIVYENAPAFVFPVGVGKLRPAVDALLEYAAAMDFPFVLRGVTDVHREQLEREYPGCFDFIEDDKSADYIYLAEKLSTYSGKALHAKKNHCNRFESEHDWAFVPLTPKLIPQCREMLAAWTEENAARLDESIGFEQAAITRLFNVYPALGMDGGVLFADQRIVGFTVGEMVSSDTFDVHIEKADTAMNGAYPMVCREFVRLLLTRYPGLKYINREDDMGLESLRRSKLSYKPEIILKKYTARWLHG